jgi:hypothetical protein
MLLLSGMLVAPTHGAPTLDVNGSARPLIFSRSIPPDKSLPPTSRSLQHLQWGLGPLSVPWDRGTLSIKPKELCLGPPRGAKGYTSRSLHHLQDLHPNWLQALPRGGHRHAAHQVPWAGPV